MTDMAICDRFKVFTLVLIILTTTTGVPDAPADIVFLIDSSGSIGVGNFEIQRNFIKNVTSAFTIAADYVRIGAVSFSTMVRTEFTLNDYSSKNSILNAIDKIGYMQVLTHTWLGLEHVRVHSFTAAEGDRQYVPNILIVLTDGQSQNESATVAEAIRVRAANIHVFCIGIGDKLNENELAAIASKSEYRYDVANFNSLGNIVSTISQEAKEVINCGDPDDLDNGDIDKSGTVYGHTAAYSCRDDFTLVDGDATRTCQLNMTWSGYKPRCAFSNPCGSNPCKNDGTCLNAIEFFNCTCPSGWSGIYCEFDIQPPVFTGCSNNISHEITQSTKQVNWRSPSFSDPFGHPVTVSTNYPQHGFKFPWGDFKVQYVGLKESNGNRSECTFDVKIRPRPCNKLGAPAKGAVVCNGWKTDFGQYCLGFCHNDFTLGPRYTAGQMHVCGATGMWAPASQLPSCSYSASSPPSKFSFSDCSNSTTQQQMKDIYITELRDSSLRYFCTKYHSECIAENVSVECD